jgi:hypothetical protein
MKVGLAHLPHRPLACRNSVSGGASPASTSKGLRHRFSGSKNEGDPPADLETGTRAPPKPVSFLRLAALARPDALYVFIGTIAAAGNGLMFPIFSLLLSRIIAVFYEPPAELKGDANFWAGMFVVGYSHHASSQICVLFVSCLLWRDGLAFSSCSRIEMAFEQPLGSLKGDANFWAGRLTVPLHTLLSIYFSSAAGFKGECKH